MWGSCEAEPVALLEVGRQGEVLETYLWSHQVLVALYQLFPHEPDNVGCKQMLKVQLNKLFISI